MEFDIGSLHAAIAVTYNLVPGSKGLLALMRAFHTSALYSARSSLISSTDKCVAIGDESGLFDFIVESLNS